MARVALDQEMLEAAVTGGSFYGGGGGGSAAAGREMGRLAIAMGDPFLVDPQDLSDDALLLTVSAVGAPAAQGRHAKAYHYLKAIELFKKHTGKEIAGFITNECGGLATVNGWVQAAAFGLPVVDAPCNGRAHPTGTMGSMGLHKVSGYMSRQVAVGGNPETGTYVESFVQGSIERAANLVRQAAVQAGGLVAVARNPVDVAYARKNAAVGAVARCIETGRAMLQTRGRCGMEVVETAAGVSGGAVVCRGKVVSKTLETAGGFDAGTVVVDGGDGVYQLTFWNEHMTLEREGRRLATFPDLIATMDAGSGDALSSAEVQTSQEVAVVTVPRSGLILGAGVKDRELYRSIETVVGKEVISYAFPGEAE